MLEPFADIALFSEDDLHKLPATEVLAYIQNIFQKWGIYGRKLTLGHEGEKYAFSCDEKAFVVYRLVSGVGGPPGWPVCLVTAAGIIDECSPPYHDEDYFASHLGLADWLTIIQQDYEDS